MKILLPTKPFLYLAIGCLLLTVISSTNAQPETNTPPATPAAQVAEQAPANGVQPVNQNTEAHPNEAGTENTTTEAGGHEEVHHPTPEVSLIWVLPFALLLMSIAIMPLINHHFWEKWYPAFSIVLGLITATYYLFFFHDLPSSRAAWIHEMQEYTSFIALLASLYIVSGGIVIHVSRKATPMTNTVLLLIGGIIANVVGTTGAAMLLIRPFIRINRKHIKPYHLVFFIFIVANCGGCLTPIGDPPLFMGFLKGIPFFWVFEHLWPMWALVLVILLVLFYFVDRMDHAKEKRQHEHDAGPAVEIFGMQNFLFIGMIIIGVFRPSIFQAFESGEYFTILGSREFIQAMAAIASLKFTRKYIYERNEFNWEPIREVAILFVGIFSTMVPALNYLNLNSEKLPLKTAGQYYFITGTLSSMLDNAPTYLVFLETERATIDKKFKPDKDLINWALQNGSMDDLLKASSAPATTPAETTAVNKWIEFYQKHSGEDPEVYDPEITDEELHKKAQEAVIDGRHAISNLLKYHQKEVTSKSVTMEQINIALLVSDDDHSLFLIAISIGAVFFGAMTYIGNGPNFMVKSIAESSGVKMPSFFGYLFRYAIPILLPILIIVWVVFFLLGVGI